MTHNAPIMRRPRFASGRQVVYLLLILGVAVVVTWWSAQSKDQQAATIRRGVGGLIAATCAGVVPPTALEIEPIIRHPATSVLKQVCRAYNDDQTRIAIIAVEDDGADPQTWTAKILVDGVHAVSLTISDRSGGLSVTGASTSIPPEDDPQEPTS